MSELAKDRYRRLENSVIYTIEGEDLPQSAEEALQDSPPVQSQPPTQSPTQSQEAKQRAKLKQIALYVLDRVSSAKDHKIPMLPRVAAQAIEMANDPNVSVRDLERIIQPDPLITARVLSIANSCLYTSSGAEVFSLRAAIQRLGLIVIRDILYQTVIEAHVFRGKAEKELRRQRIHSVGVAYLARDVWKAIGAAGHSAFLCGLLHDIGMVILHQILMEDPPPELNQEEFPTVMELIHPQIGELVCERWGLPALTWEGARRHHVFRGYGDGQAYSQLGHVIAVAEFLAAQVGLGEEGTGDAPGPESEAIFFELGLTGDQIDDLKGKAEVLAKSLLGG